MDSLEVDRFERWIHWRLAILEMGALEVGG